MDIRPAYDAYNFRGLIPRGQGVRCRDCAAILEFSQWRLLAAKFAPCLILIPFIWYRDTTVAERVVIAVLAVGPFLMTTFRLIPSLYDLKIPTGTRDVRPDDELHEGINE